MGKLIVRDGRVFHYRSGKLIESPKIWVDWYPLPPKRRRKLKASKKTPAFIAMKHKLLATDTKEQLTDYFS